MSNFSTHLQGQQAHFQGKPQLLQKLIKKLDVMAHAPTTEKHSKRIQPFAQEPLLVDFLNEQLKHYFLQEQAFQAGHHYDIIKVWYVFTILVYAEEVQPTVELIWKSMKANSHPDSYLLRRILALCNNPIYQQLQQEVEQYFAQLLPQTKLYQWLQDLKVIPPSTLEWGFTIRLQTLLHASKGPITLIIRGHAPKGDGSSFEISIQDQQHQIQGKWDDFSTHNFITIDANKKPLGLVPQLENLKATIEKLEKLLALKIDRNIHFQYFSKGFKQKNNIQKWLLKA